MQQIRTAKGQITGLFDGWASSTAPLAVVTPRRLAAAGFFVGASWLYAPILLKLAHDWWTIPDYSHGFLVAPLAAALIWARRRDFAAAPQAPSRAGVLLAVVALALLLVGTLGAELFLTRVSLLAFGAGTIVYLYGWRHLRIVAFPLVLLALTIPIPAIVISRLTLTLQLWASTIAETILWAGGIPVLREGNVLVLPNATLQVAEACSGIRSLTALVTLALVVARFSDTNWPRRAAIVLSAIPIAVLVNGLRVAATAFGARWFGVAAVEGTVHEMLGWVMFLIAFALVAACARTVMWRAPQPVGAR